MACRPTRWLLSAAGDDGLWRRRHRNHTFEHGGIARTRQRHVEALGGVRLNASRSAQRLEIETKMPVDVFLGGALLLHLLQAIAVSQQLEMLPGREQQHRNDEHAER